MSNLISGKEAKLAWANGKDVEFYSESLDTWFSLNDDVFLSDVFDKRKLRLKPQTITINGIEVPAPFEPKDGEKYFYLNLQRECLYAAKEFNGNYSDNSAVELGAWRTEDEIKQVVEALRSVFKPQ